MSNQIRLQPISNSPHLAEAPLAWSLKLWGEGKEEFSAQDWQDFYANAAKANYEHWDFEGIHQELLYLAIRNSNGNGTDEVVAAIALCDFDDLEELRDLKPWIAAFIVREDLRGSGIGTVVLKLAEEKALSFGIVTIYLWTEGQMPFYSKRGYQRIDHLIKPNRVIDVMKKNLSK
jgi:N-acetylglutamate synthase-like GNAT family acetyltransferase